MTVTFFLNGSELAIDGDGTDRTLLDALRGEGGVRSAKDGCAPQGQCGCCTVLVDGKARVACVTPLRRVAGREVTTVEGLAAGEAARWADALGEHGGSQCGFCTPGMIMRLEDRRRRATGESAGDPTVVRAVVQRALAAHLCRCTGWQGITEAAVEVITGAKAQAGSARVRSDPTAAARRASIESGSTQRIDREAVLGGGGFAADTAPADSLVAMPDADGNWILAASVAEARELAGKVQGRRSTLTTTRPLEAPPGDWGATLLTSWVEPGYLETDASWCEPGGEPAGPLANGGAFGAKLASPLPGIARLLADDSGRPVLALWSREDSVRNGPKRPPVAIGLNGDGTGVARVAACTGIAEAIRSAAPLIDVEEVVLSGPTPSVDLRGAGWVEAFCASVAVGAQSPLGGLDADGVRVQLPNGAWARAEVSDNSVAIAVGAGDPLDEVVLRSFCTGAVHMAAGLVCSEGLAVDESGSVQDLTIRSFGILAASDMPQVDVTIDPESPRGDPVAVGDAVFAAAAAVLWRHHGFAPAWPLGAAVL